MKSLGAVVLVKAVNNLFRKSADDTIQGHLMGLEELVSNFASFGATGSGVIQSLVALAEDAQTSVRRIPGQRTFNMSVDFGTDPASSVKVYKEFTRHCIETSQSLDIICRHWAPDDGLVKLPSWISTISKRPYRNISGFSLGRELEGHHPRVPDVLWRSLIADRTSSGDNPPGWYRRACLSAVRHRADLDLDVYEWGQREKSGILAKFGNRVLAATWNHKFFIADRSFPNSLYGNGRTTEQYGGHRTSTTRAIIRTRPGRN